jgi:Glycosyl transferase family 2
MPQSPSAQPSLSIIVPTRNRHHTAESLLRGLHAEPYPDFEVIVQDNSDSDRMAAFVAALADPRIKYAYRPEAMNMHQNFDMALQRANGAYWIAIGDDDGVLVGPALRAIKRAQEQDLDAVLAPIFSYAWPGLKHRIWGEMGGQTDLQSRLCADGTVMDPDALLKSVYAGGLLGGVGNLPRIYQGLVSRRAMDALYARCGTYFPGASPDMANAVGLVPYVNGMLYVHEPMIIAGHSARSGGGQGNAGTHHGEVAQQPHLPADTAEKWHPAIPFFWSAPTIYAQSVVTAVAATQPQFAAQPAWHRLYAACLVYESRQYWPRVRSAMAASGRNPLLLALAIMAWASVMVGQRAITFVRNLAKQIGASRKTTRISDMEELFSTLQSGKAG